jgi:hypothetical protein
MKEILPNDGYDRCMTVGREKKRRKEVGVSGEGKKLI